MSAFLRWSGHPVRLAECLQMTHRGAAIASVAPASSGSVQQEIEAPREDVKGEDYEDFARSAAANPIGRNVKLADLADNCDLSRIAEPTEADYQRIERYRLAIKLIHSI